MSDHALAEIFMVVSIVLAIALLFKAQESSHWKHSYETLRNEVLAQGKQDTYETVQRLHAINERYDEMVSGVRKQYSDALSMTLDEFVDSQG